MWSSRALVARAARPLPNELEPLVVWDVGLGAAANAMAAILAVEASQDLRQRRPLTLVSFENDLDSLELALDHPGGSSICATRPRGRCCAITAGPTAAANIDWLLLCGDFALRKFEAPPPDIIFFDPFSFKTDSCRCGPCRRFANWPGCAAINRRSSLPTPIPPVCAPPCWLPASMLPRAAARAQKAKRPSACRRARPLNAHGHELLGQNGWTEWRRSDAQAPFGSLADDASWHDAVIQHPQFARPGID